MAESDLIYKMTVLALLKRSEDPLSDSQITRFFLDMDYTDYFTVQETLYELEKSHLVTGEKSHHRTLYRATEEGLKTLGLLSDRVTPSIQKDIDSFLETHRLRFRVANSVSSVYDLAAGGGYLVHLRADDRSHPIMDLTIHVTSRDQADAFCSAWKDHYMDVYAAILDELVQ